MANYQQIFDLSKDAAFVGKLQVAVIKYAEYLLGEDPTTAYHVIRIRWADNIVRNGVENTVTKIALAVAFDGTIQAHLSDYTDDQLQSATEVRINRIM